MRAKNDVIVTMIGTIALLLFLLFTYERAVEYFYRGQKLWEADRR